MCLACLSRLVDAADGLGLVALSCPPRLPRHGHGSFPTRCSRSPAWISAPPFSTAWSADFDLRRSSTRSGSLHLRRASRCSLNLASCSARRSCSRHSRSASCSAALPCPRAAAGRELPTRRRGREGAPRASACGAQAAGRKDHAAARCQRLSEHCGRDLRRDGCAGAQPAVYAKEGAGRVEGGWSLEA